MANEVTRRDVMKTGLAARRSAPPGSFEWVLPALAQGDWCRSPTRPENFQSDSRRPTGGCSTPGR